MYKYYWIKILECKQYNLFGPKPRSLFKILGLLLCFFVVNLKEPLLAQFGGLKPKSTLIDTSYVKSYRHQLLIRTYAITKYNKWSFIDNSSGDQFNFEPNSNLNLGLGFNYKWVGLNAAFNFPIINNDDDKLGDTRFLDLQADFYGRRHLINIIYQDYKGYRITESNLILPQISVTDTFFSKRSDISTRAFGLNGFYNFNQDRFSFLSSFIQNEWQKRSAGSFFVGGYLSWLQMRSDSSFVPSSLNNNFPLFRNVNTTEFGNLGVSGGYAYTFVFFKNFFITLSAALGIGGEISKASADDQEDFFWREASINYSAFTKGAVGYNKDSFHIGLNFSSNFNTFHEQQLSRVIYQFGNVRFYFVKRFNIDKPFWKN